MISITTYKLKPFLTKDEVRELMSVFAKEGPGPGTTAHYVAADGRGGLVITDSDDLEACLHELEVRACDRDDLIAGGRAKPILGGIHA